MNEFFFVEKHFMFCVAVRARRIGLLGPSIRIVLRARLAASGFMMLVSQLTF